MFINLKDYGSNDDMLIQSSLILSVFKQYKEDLSKETLDNLTVLNENQNYNHMILITFTIGNAILTLSFKYKKEMIKNFKKLEQKLKIIDQGT